MEIVVDNRKFMPKTYTNSDIYEFLSEEAKHHSMHLSTADLMARANDVAFWEELSEKVDCFRICDHCHKPMIEGYCIDDGCEHYCSDDCLHNHYSDVEFDEMYAEGDGTSYYTNWYEESITYKNN